MSFGDKLFIFLLVIYLVIFILRLLKRRGVLNKLIRNIFADHLRMGRIAQARQTLQGGLMFDLLTGDEYRQLEKLLPNDPHP